MNEVQELVKQDIWEPVDKSIWQHQLVTVPKPDSTPQITTDLLPLNQFIISDCHPILNIKELFLEFQGVWVFSKLDL